MAKIEEILDPPSVAQLIDRFGRQPMPFILDSAQSNDGLGNWSFFGCKPFHVLGGNASLDDLRGAMAPYATENKSSIPFMGGAVGFLSYDYGRRIEHVPTIAKDDRAIPDMYFGLYDGIAAFNHQSGRLYLIALGIRSDPDDVIDELREIIFTDREVPDSKFKLGNWSWNLSEEAFSAAVQSIRSYIASGDVYQVNLSRRARCQFEGCPVALYHILRAGNPAPYGAYLDMGDLQLISTSPEQFLRKRGSSIETRPIKGTRPRGKDSAEDAALARALKLSEKDRAELLMIVDLERNDLGRVASYGSVRVSNLYHLEHYAKVMHQTAQVRGELAAGKDVFDCIHALFPGGSITGAPKIRAMEIIEELEPTRRGAYCGSIGYIGFDGDAEFNIAIRSMHIKDGYLDYQVGSGIVWDSGPEAEYAETLDKARAIHETIEKRCRRSS
ncbi:MAG: aminodeoxychorismate synthase component I [Verrucomicrobiota bacterium]